jgi:hypothetical protein
MKLEKRVTQIEKKIYRELDLKAIVPPKILIPYLNGEKISEGTEEAKAILELYPKWQKAVLLAMKRGSVNFGEVMAALPRPYRLRIEDSLRHQYGKNQLSEVK